MQQPKILVIEPTNPLSGFEPALKAALPECEVVCYANFQNAVQMLGLKKEHAIVVLSSAPGVAGKQLRERFAALREAAPSAKLIYYTETAEGNLSVIGADARAIKPDFGELATTIKRLVASML